MNASLPGTGRDWTVTGYSEDNHGESFFKEPN